MPVAHGIAPIWSFYVPRPAPSSPPSVGAQVEVGRSYQVSGRPVGRSCRVLQAGEGGQTAAVEPRSFQFSVTAARNIEGRDKLDLPVRSYLLKGLFGLANPEAERAVYGCGHTALQLLGTELLVGGLHIRALGFDDDQDTLLDVMLPLEEDANAGILLLSPHPDGEVGGQVVLLVAVFIHQDSRPALAYMLFGLVGV